MQWQDIEACCKRVLSEATANDRNKIGKDNDGCLLPHSEEMLSLLLNVHVVGGTKDLVEHLEGATIQPAIVKA